MSVFQLQEWWSVKVSENEEFDHGCMVVGNVDNAVHPTVKICVGSLEGMFRMYYPTKPGYRVEDLVLEESLGLPILQLLLGKFIPSTDILGIAVLHPKKLVVYEIVPQGVKDGRVNYYSMRKAYQHILGLEGKHFTAYNMTCGAFGGVKGRELFIIQSMDGKIQIFEQSANAFARQLADYLIPGPICYLPKIDAFVTVNHSCHAECYKYQVLASSQDKNVDTNSDLNKSSSNGLTAVRGAMVEWTMNVGESCRQVLNGYFSSDGSNSTVKSNLAGGELLMVCDKSLFLLKGENGGLIQQRRLERSDASCVCSFPSQQEGGLTHNFLLATQDHMIQIYSGFNLVWATKTTSTPVQMEVGTFGDQKGLIVTIDDSGSLCLSYLGTKPPINAVLTQVRELDYDKIDEEHRSLLNVIRESQNENRLDVPEKLIIRSQLPKSLTTEPSPVALDMPTSLVPLYTSMSADGQVVKICVRLYLTYSGSNDKSSRGYASNVSLTVSTPSFVLPVPKNIIIQKVSTVKSTPVMVKIFFFATKDLLPSCLDATINASYLSSKGEPRIASHVIQLPIFLACRPKAPMKSALCKVVIDTEVAAVSLTDLFDDFLFASQESGCDVSDVLGSNATQAMGFQLWAPVSNTASSSATDSQQLSSVVSILVSKNAGRYRVQADSYPALYLIIEELEKRLTQKMNGSDPTSTTAVKCTDSLPIEEYFSVINEHFKLRLLLVQLNSQLNDLAHQFRLVQKRLLVRFKDRNPTPLGGLDFLLKETYSKIIQLSKLYSFIHNFIIYFR